MRTLLLVLGLTLAFAATAAQGATRASRSTQRNGPLTVFYLAPVFLGDDIAKVETVGGASPRTIWHCPRHVVCQQPVSFAWAPDGKRLALSFDQIGGLSRYPDLHIVNVASGRDTDVLRDRVGCFPAAELAWSPDGSRLAYNCPPGGSIENHGQLNLLKLGGLGYRPVSRAGSKAFWPSWSPSGTRLAYSTQLKPTGAVSRIYTAALDGSHKRLLVAGRAVAPAWSPDGRTIAYQTTCGIRLVTPFGRDVTPRATANGCGAIGHSGPPAWSPDGTMLAVETKAGIYVMDASGKALHRVSRHAATTWYGKLPGRPSWRPIH